MTLPYTNFYKYNSYIDLEFLEIEDDMIEIRDYTKEYFATVTREELEKYLQERKRK